MQLIKQIFSLVQLLKQADALVQLLKQAFALVQLVPCQLLCQGLTWGTQCFAWRGASYLPCLHSLHPVALCFLWSVQWVDPIGTQAKLCPRWPKHTSHEVCASTPFFRQALASFRWWAWRWDRPYGVSQSALWGGPATPCVTRLSYGRAFPILGLAHLKACRDAFDSSLSSESQAIPIASRFGRFDR